MDNDGTIQLLAVGPAARMGAFVESLLAVPAVAVRGLLDAAPNPDGLQVAKRCGLPLYARTADVPDLAACDLLALYDDDAEAMLDRAGIPASATVLKGASLHLVRALAHALYTAKPAGPSAPAKGRPKLHRECAAELIGASSALDEVRSLIAQVATTPTTVLFLGETGVGKDLAARIIHERSRVADKPFIPVNCTALVGSLMESELFGHRKGAFTGADEERPGLLEEADGGTLFLDEIGDMPLELQAKLLRFLQTGEVRRVGAVKSRRVEVRVIAATNRDMDKAQDEGLFRRDLYHRFNTFTIRIPPLRERRVDVPRLALHFLTRAEKRLNKSMSGIDDAAMSLLVDHDWPGNARELANVIERAVILARSEFLTAADLPAGLGHSGISHPNSHDPVRFSRPDEDPADYHASRERVMETFERKELERRLKAAGGNVSEACRQSGIPRRTFYRKLQKYGL